jgi:hypothetical protein
MAPFIEDDDIRRKFSGLPIFSSYLKMDNHYHLLLQTPAVNLPQIRRHINGAYTTK